MSERILEVQGSSPSLGAVFARVLKGGADFSLSEDATLDGSPVAGVRVPRALDDQGRQRKGLFGFYLKDPAEAARFKAGSKVVLNTREDVAADVPTVLEEALSELRRVVILIWPAHREDFLTALANEREWVPRLGQDPATAKDAIRAIRHIRNAIVHGVEPLAKKEGFKSIDEFLKAIIAPELKSVRQLRVRLEERAA